MNWAFVDHENVGALEALNISAYESDISYEIER